MMEIKGTDKIVIAKPIACRPGLTNLKSFSKVLTGETNASPPADFSESAVAVIRPRTTRLKSVSNTDLVGAEVLGSAACHEFKKVPESNIAANVVYKPIAKLVSKTTISLLANLGGRGIGPTREITDVGTCTLQSNQEKHKNESERTADVILETSDYDIKSSSFRSNVDRSSYDGHNWRKYGQKQVKGSEYPRSYYKCTHPNCPVKKKVEKTLDGEIAEIVYKGEHNHSKPQILNHAFIDGQAQNPEIRSENKDNFESSGQPAFRGAAAPANDLVTAATCNASVSTSNNSLGLSGECEEVSESLEAEGDEFKSKRTKRENQLFKASTVGEASCEPQSAAHNNTDSETIGDGFRWRKYGQKVVKGNRYPRSYYRCTSPKCSARKFVERTSEELGTFVTTYEGKHNHSMPTKSTNSEASRTSTKNKSLNG